MANLEYFSDEDVISFTLLDAHTVERLQRKGDIKLPKKKVDIPKDERWNTKLMSSKLLQGILAGDAIPTIANSLMQVIGNNAAAAVRNARTMVTGAENVGRLDSYEDLAEKGVVQKKVWIATADDRTRESHLLLDGEEVDIDKPFSNGLMYPADPSGDPAEVYNCRCSMRDHIVGFRRADGTISLVGAERDTTSHAGKIEEEIAQRGLEKVAVKENFEPVEITPADWEDWAVDPEPYKAVISGEPVPNYSQGSKLTAEEKRRIESVALQMQERAETETVNFDTLYRGESYSTLKEAQEKYAVGNIVVNDTLTSYATSSDIAMEYAKQGEGVNVVITNTNIDNSFNGFVGVMTDPLDVGGSEEVITAKGMESKVFSSYYDKDTNTLYVGMTTDSVPAEIPAEAPAAPAEPTAVESSTAVEYKTFDAEADMQTEIVGRVSFGGRHSEGHEVQYAKEYKGDGSETTQFFADNSNNTELIDSMSANDMKAFKDLWSKGQFMQGQQYGDFSDMKPRFQSATRIFDKYLDQTTIDQNIEVVRLSDAQLVFGAGNRSGSLEDFAAMEGQQIICNANMSFSAASEGLRINYTGAAPTVEYVLRIPEGSNGSGMYIGDDRINVWGDRQREFMTNRNIWMTVGKTEYIEDRGIYRVELNYGGRMEHDYK